MFFFLDSKTSWPRKLLSSDSSANFNLKLNLQGHTDEQKNSGGQHKLGSDLPQAKFCHDKRSLLFCVSCCHLWLALSFRLMERANRLNLGRRPARDE